MARLKIEETFDLPIAEASGLCTSMISGAECLVAIGDADTSVCWSPLVDGRPTQWEVLDVAGIAGLPEDLGQFEAVADAGTGRLLIMGEEPALLVLIDPVEQRNLGWWHLTTAEKPDFARLWDKDPNSRGEGMLLLGDGHVLVLKEKRPVMMIEYGLGGRTSWDRVIPAGSWREPPGSTLPVVHWSEVDGAPSDVSDCAWFDGRLIALSDRDCCLVVLTASQESYVAGEPIALDKDIEKPEGLTVTSSGEWFVAMDKRDGAEALVRIRAPEL